MTAQPHDLFAPPAPETRVFSQARRAGLGDCAPSGRMRLDAIARWLQDVAWSDVADAGLDDRAFWILRRTRIRVEAFPRINAPQVVSTFCSGTGRLVAERRTRIAPAESPETPSVETVSLWVHLDPVTRRPANLSPEELAVYATAGPGARRVSHRLIHPRPALGPEDVAVDWRFRRVDTDVADHVNNAAYWELLEEELLAGADPERIDAEVEFRDGAQPGPARWVTPAAAPAQRAITEGAGELLATVVVHELSR